MSWPFSFHCTLDPIERLLLVPDESGNPYAEFSVTVIDMWDCTTPIPNVFVEVLIGGQVDGKVRLCDQASTVGITDENGFVEFYIAGGGCIKEPWVVEIRANGVTIRQYGAVMSPDYAGWDKGGLSAEATWR